MANTFFPALKVINSERSRKVGNFTPHLIFFFRMKTEVGFFTGFYKKAGSVRFVEV